MPESLYRLIADDLRQKIESAELGRDGRALPTELELREQYKASRNTVRDAVKWLISRGLVETRPGQGTFVIRKIDPFVTLLSLESGLGSGDEASNSYKKDVQDRLRRPKVSVPRIEIQQAAGVIASELRLGEDTNVVSRHQQRFIDDTAWSLQTSFYPMLFVEQGATDLLRAAEIPDGTVSYLEQVLGIKQVGWRDKITVRAPDMIESAFFKLPDDGRVAVFENHRTSYDETGKPIRLTVTTYPADRNQFVVAIGDVPTDITESPVNPPEGNADPVGSS